MRLPYILLALCLLAPAVSAQAPAAAEPGTRSSARSPMPAKIGKDMRAPSAGPHHLGSPYDKDNAEWIAGLEAVGWEARFSSSTCCADAESAGSR